MNFKSSRLPSSSEDIERYWKYAVQENTDFTSIVINRNAVDFTKSVDYFDLTDKEADEVSFAGRNVEFFSHPVSLKEFEQNIFGELNADTQIGVLLSNVNRLRTEAEVYGMYVTFSYIGKSVYCAITICLVDKDFGMEMETAVIEIGQDEEPYILPHYINEEALDYFTCDDIAKLSYWLGNFWVGIQYKIHNRPEEVKIVEQRGPISPNEEPVRKRLGFNKKNNSCR